ncbi:hypothetical protein BHE74_00043810 [Ensete ventricosum]|nr:hypothetical protein BHE74_00043810 [Ensete ventricosum]
MNKVDTSQLQHGADHRTLPTAAYTVGNPSIGSSGDTPQMESPVAPNREVQLETEVLQRRTAEVHANSPTVPARSRSHSHDLVQASPDLDTLSSDSADLLREQVRQVHQQLDEVQKEVLKSKGEVEESSKGGSPVTPEIQDKPLSTNFRLPALKLYDGSCDLTEHVATFRTQMALYDTSDALMCRAFPTTQRGPARTWYCRLKPASISSFDLLSKEFELNFLVSARPKPTVASLLGLAQGNDESLAEFVGRFTSQVRGVLDVHPSLAIQAFLIGLKPSRFFWSLIERPPVTVPEMLQRAHQYIAAEALVVGKRDESKRPRVEQHRGHPSRPTKRREDRSDMLPSRPPPIPLNSTRTDIFLQIRERGLLKTPNPMKTCFEMRDKRIYYRFHTEHDHDMEECRDLQSQIEDLNPARALVSLCS